MHGTWRCVCEQDTVSIHVTEVSSFVLELAICILRLLFHAVSAGICAFKPNLLELIGVEAVEEQHAWYVEVCVSRIR